MRMKLIEIFNKSDLFHANFAEKISKTNLHTIIDNLMLLLLYNRLHQNISNKIYQYKMKINKKLRKKIYRKLKDKF